MSEENVKRVSVDNKVDRNIILLSTLVSLVVFVVSSGRIDIHPDEAIYYDAIAISLRNDAGLFYSLFYSFFVDFFGGIEGARYASAVLGSGTLFFVLSSLRKTGAGFGWIVLAALVFLLSYQSIFIFDRIRPEASWWFLSTVMIYGLISYEVEASKSKLLLLLLIAFLLPMNHRLSWFPCLFIVGYIVLFFFRRHGLNSSLAILSAMLLGVMANIVVRAWLISRGFDEAFQVAMSDSPGVDGQSFVAYFRLVFLDSLRFLNDSAVNSNFYNTLGWISSESSHAFVQAMGWLLMFVLPFFTKLWRVRYAVSFPLFSFLCFYLSGYYNPTYAPGFSLFCLLALLFIVQEHKVVYKAFVVLISVASIINGTSFLTTRVFNHGTATVFEVENQLQQLLQNIPHLNKVAIPERLSSLKADFDDIKFYVDYKEQIPSDVDVLIIDDYDRGMYHFVPNYDEVRSQLISQAETMCLIKSFSNPVYKNDTLFSDVGGDDKNKQQMGSWFFRNSAQYTISAYVDCDYQKTIMKNILPK